ARSDADRLRRARARARVGGNDDEHTGMHANGILPQPGAHQLKLRKRSVAVIKSFTIVSPPNVACWPGGRPRRCAPYAQANSFRPPDLSLCIRGSSSPLTASSMQER